MKELEQCNVMHGGCQLGDAGRFFTAIGIKYEDNFYEAYFIRTYHK
jgi:hypothetical protein